jgi:hypothetical protein
MAKPMPSGRKRRKRVTMLVFIDESGPAPPLPMAPSLGSSAPCRSRCSQSDGQRIAAKHHYQDEPPNRLLGVGVGPEQFRHVSDRRGLGLDLPALGGHGGAFRLQSRQPASRFLSSASPPRAFFCPSMADRAALVRPFSVAFSIVLHQSGRAADPNPRRCASRLIFGHPGLLSGFPAPRFAICAR